MKKLNLLRFAALFSLLILLFSSCSEDALKQELASSRSTMLATNPTNSIMNDPGSIQAIITPNDLKVSMEVYNDDYRSKITYTNEEGFIESREIPPGIYTVLLHVVADVPLPRDYWDIVIEKVIVNSGDVTDLRNIRFD